MDFHTSDWHLGHTNIIGFVPRPFKDVIEMNMALVHNHNKLVGPNDTTYFHGDMCMGGVETTLRYISMLQGRKVLLPGNHDKCWPGHATKITEKWKPIYEDAGFEVVEPQQVLDVCGHKVLACHFPYHGDSHGKDRYSGMRPEDTGMWLIHGHTHSQYVWSEGRQIHIGVDAWNYYPVPDFKIAELIEYAEPGSVC